METEEMGKGVEVRVPEVTLAQFLRRRRNDVWKRRRLYHRFEYGGAPVTIDVYYYTLDRSAKRLMRDVGEALYSRFSSGLGVKLPPSLNGVVVVDNFARLPPPSSLRKDNCKESLKMVETYQDYWKEILAFGRSQAKDFAECPENMSLKLCFDYLLLEKLPARLLLFNQVMSHPRFNSASNKLTLVEHSYRFFKKNNAAMIGYTNLHALRGYDILSAIRSNPVFLEVYFYNPRQPAMPDESAAEQRWTQYKNCAMDILLFMSTFIKHSDQTCSRLGLDPWTDEQKSALLEYYFPKVIHELFYYLWTHNIVIDDEQLRKF